MRIRNLLPEIGAAGAELGALLPPVPAGGPDRELRCRAALASTFVGGLELARDGAIVLQQQRAFAEISAWRRDAG